MKALVSTDKNMHDTFSLSILNNFYYPYFDYPIVVKSLQEVKKLATRSNFIHTPNLLAIYKVWNYNF